jgi:hypothetical protein
VRDAPDGVRDAGVELTNLVDRLPSIGGEFAGRVTTSRGRANLVLR